MAAVLLAAFGNKEVPEVANAVHRPSGHGPMPVPPVQRQSTAGPGTNDVQALAVVPRQELIPVRQAAMQVDLFSIRNWTPPPPPVHVPPPAVPIAPPMPYVFAGKKEERGAWEVYLTRGDFSFVVQQGSVLEDAYVVEQIHPPVLTMLYKPLGQRQHLAIGEP